MLQHFILPVIGISDSFVPPEDFFNNYISQLMTKKTKAL